MPEYDEAIREAEEAAERADAGGLEGGVRLMDAAPGAREWFS